MKRMHSVVVVFSVLLLILSVAWQNPQDTKDYHLDVPVGRDAFYVKGATSYDWGMQNRLARIFNPDSGKTVMLAIDHGYFQGPTTGLERIDLTVVPLMVHADAVMLTRGILRTTVPPTLNKPIVMRCSGGPSILKELSNEELADLFQLEKNNVAVRLHRIRMRLQTEMQR